MFFEHRQLRTEGGTVSLSSAEFLSDFDSLYLAERFAELKTLAAEGAPARSVRVLKTARRMGDEEYTVRIGGEVVIETPTPRGALYALSDLKDMAIGEGVPRGAFSDAPVCPFRAYRAYLPSREETEAFFEAARFMTDFKYNTVILELGGAMEYKRHPEINAAWKKLADDVRRYSGRSLEIQLSVPWEKDSIHAENAGGEILTQDEVRDIFERLRGMGFEVIPEVPTLSHADYICLAHPELAERKEDAFPDTYCPSDERTYTIVFDILDEVLGLLSPKTVHIGHDEYYSMALCERCRGKDPAALYAGDVKRIRDYLAERGVATMMWGEKLIDARQNGQRVGGAGVDRINEAGFHVTVPPLYTCAGLLPRDVFMLNWYWEFGARLDRAFIDNGYRFAYGNMYGARIDDWRARVNGGALGGAVSNWGGFGDAYMQRNLQWYSLAAAAYLFWSQTYDSPQAPALDEKVAAALYRRRLAGIPQNERVEIEHAVRVGRKHEFFYCGVFIPDTDRLGDYVLTYADGSTARLPVAYGYNVSGPAKPGTPEYYEPMGSCLPAGGRWRAVWRNPKPGAEIAGIRFEPRPGCAETLDFELLKDRGAV